MGDLKIGVVLVNYHTNDQTIAIANKYAKFESIFKVVIVNNDAAEEYFIKEQSDQKIEVINIRENLGYSKGNNIGINTLVADGCQYIIISNSDIDVDEACIVSCVKYIMDDETLGIVAPRMKFPEGRYAPLRYLPLNYSRIFLRVFLPEPVLDKMLEQKVKIVNGLAFQSYVPGSFFIINSSSVGNDNFFDPEVFLYREEEILGVRIKELGYRVAVSVNNEFIHNHIYFDDSFEKKKNMNVMMMKSERLYFKKYLKANRIQMIYVNIMQKMFSIIRYSYWKMMGIMKK